MQIKSDMLTIKPIQRRLSTENRLDSPFSDGILGKNMPDMVEQNQKRNLIYKNDAKSDMEALLELLGQLKIANDGGSTVNIQHNIINQIKNSIQIHSKSIHNITVQNSLKELLQENKISETTINMAIAHVEQSLKKKITNHEVVFGGDTAFYLSSIDEKHAFSVENKAVHLAENFRESYTQNNYATQNTFGFPTNIETVYESREQNFHNYILHNSRIIETIYDKKKALEGKRESASLYRYAVDNDFLYYEKTEQVYQNQEKQNTNVSVTQNQETYNTNVSVSQSPPKYDTHISLEQNQSNLVTEVNLQQTQEGHHNNGSFGQTQENHKHNVTLHQNQEKYDTHISFGQNKENQDIFLQTNLYQNQENNSILTNVEHRSVLETSEEAVNIAHTDAVVLQNNVSVTQSAVQTILEMEGQKLPLPQLFGKRMVAENTYRSLFQYDFHIMETLPQNIRNILQNVALFVTQNRSTQFHNSTFGKMERIHFQNRMFYSRILNAHTTLENKFTEANSYVSEMGQSVSLIQKMQGESIYHQQGDFLYQDTNYANQSVDARTIAVSNVSNNQHLVAAPSNVLWTTLFQEFHKIQGEYNANVTQNWLHSSGLPSGVKRIFAALQMSTNNAFTNTRIHTQQNQMASNVNTISHLQLMNVENAESTSVSHGDTVHQSTTNQQMYMTQQAMVEGDNISLSYHQENQFVFGVPETYITKGYFRKNANTQMFSLTQNKGISTVLQNIFHNQKFGDVYPRHQKNVLPIGVEKVFSALQMSLEQNVFWGGDSHINQRNENRSLMYVQTNYHQYDGDDVHVRNDVLSKQGNTQIFPLSVQKNIGMVLRSLFHKESVGGIEQKQIQQFLDNISSNEYTNQYATNEMYQTDVRQQVRDVNTRLEYRVFNAIHQSPLVYHLQKGILSRVFGGTNQYFGANQNAIINHISYGDARNIYHFSAGEEATQAFLPLVQRYDTKETLFQKAKIFYSYLMKHTEESNYVAKEVLQENRTQMREQNSVLLQRYNALAEVESKELTHNTLLQQNHQTDVVATMGMRHFQKDSLWNYAYQTDMKHSEVVHQEEIKETTKEMTHKELMIFKKEQETRTEEITKTKITELVEEVLSERIVEEGFTLQQETIIQKIVGQVLLETKEESTEPTQDRNTSEYIEEIYEKVYEKIERALLSERRRFGQ